MRTDIIVRPPHLLHGPRVVMTAVVLAWCCSACDGALSDLSDDELATRASQCQQNLNPGPGSAIACDNVMRECKARRADGVYVC